MDSTLKQIAETEVTETYLALAREFQDQQLYGKAEETIFLALEKFPNHPFLLSRLSTLYLHLDMPYKAIGILDKLIQHHPRITFTYFLRGKLNQNRRRFDSAIADYESALSDSAKDSQVLQQLLPLLISRGQPERALKTISRYQQTLNQPNLFAELEAEALFNVGENVAAFKRMREVLMSRPDDKRLLKRYLHFSIRTSKKNPRDLYNILIQSVPGLPQLSEEDLIDLEVDYLIERNRFSEAVAAINEGSKISKRQFYWRKRHALATYRRGAVEEGCDALMALFEERSTDTEIRDILEQHYCGQGKKERWLQIVRDIAKPQTGNLGLFDYIRELTGKQDHLHICELNYSEFMKMVEDFNLVRSRFLEETFQRMPEYILESLTASIAIGGTVPSTVDLWTQVTRWRKRIGKSPSFTIENLDAAFPLWLFAFHLYFLFKSHSEFSVRFDSGRLVKDRIACILAIDDLCIEVDLSIILRPESKRLKELVKSSNGFRWRLGGIEPDLMLHEVNFYSDRQMGELLDRLAELLENTGKSLPRSKKEV